MQLRWSDQDRIAQALQEAYPETDRLALTMDELEGLILSLAQFDDVPKAPGKRHLEKILWGWMRAADEAMTGGVTCGDGGGC